MKEDRTKVIIIVRKLKPYLRPNDEFTTSRQLETNLERRVGEVDANRHAIIRFVDDVERPNSVESYRQLQLWCGLCAKRGRR